MRFPTIQIEGAILSAELLDQLESGAAAGQKPTDFGLPISNKLVKDEILRAWADANDYWRIFRRRLDALADDRSATTETRRQWLLPLLGLLGYDAQPITTSPTAGEKKFAISHTDARRAGLPLHLVSARDELDTRPDGRNGRRPTPHGLVQEYLNLTEHLYGLVSNGLQLRLLRDSSRLVKLSYVEFDLERMFTEGHFADFALLWRLLHASRMPTAEGKGAESLIERYHQDALEAGARIRERLSAAVYNSLLALGNGFLQHPDNDKLRSQLVSGKITASLYHQHLLRLIYRFLFLLVTEERDLLFPETANPMHREVYEKYYSLQKLRRLCENPYLPADSKTFHDLWAGLRQTFQLFESGQSGQPLGLSPLAGDLFGRSALGPIADADLRNEVLLDCLRNLTRFYNPTTRQYTRVNYGALDVEEFGSVYEGLLEFDAIVAPPTHATPWRYSLAAGKARAASGSHYTPEALVQPLLQHSLDLLINEKLREAAEGARPAPKGRSIPTEAESKAIQIAQIEALLSLRIADVACGSGHMLLSAARRLATELARVQTGQEQPSPNARRAAQRQVISQCLYGTDYNPLAVELCKVALWLEAHNPGEPLDFLDHHIRCGNAIIGLARPEDLTRGISTKAFAALKGDDKPLASALRSRNRQERTVANQTTLEFEPASRTDVTDLGVAYEHLRQMPDHTTDEVEAKSMAYRALRKQASTFRLGQLADLQVAPFFIPKTANNANLLLTDADYRRYLRGTQELQTDATELAAEVGIERRFFHWFIEFPDVMVEHGGFDMILGNPPFLGGLKISTNYGHPTLNWLYNEFAPAGGTADLVTYFFRRVHTLLRPGGFLALISTNTIAQGDTRAGSLEYLTAHEGSTINFAVKSMKWPGLAAVDVSLVCLRKGSFIGEKWLNGAIAPQITAYLDDKEAADPYQLIANGSKSFIGSFVLGKKFIITPEQVESLIKQDPRNANVLQLYLNGEDLNSRPDQSPSRWAINFRNWPLRRYTVAEWKSLDEIERIRIRTRLVDGNVIIASPPDYEDNVAEDYPHCLAFLNEQLSEDGKTHQELRSEDNRKAYRDFWWMYAERRTGLYKNLASVNTALIVARTSKTLAFEIAPANMVFADALVVMPIEMTGRFAVYQSSIHNSWAWKYCTTMKSDLNYSPSAVAETFPFPTLTPDLAQELENHGVAYYTFRKQLMLDLQIGLTKTYNLFHALDHIALAKLSKLKDLTLASTLYTRFEEMRTLHRQMDEAIARAYGWTELALDHGFHAQDYLPEKDRIRFTISPAARREVLKRLLVLNHSRYAEEQAALAENS